MFYIDNFYEISELNHILIIKIDIILLTFGRY